MKKKSLRQFLASIADRGEDSEKKEDLFGQLVNMAAHIIGFSLGDESPSTSAPSANIACIDSEDSPTCFMATLLDSITDHSLTARTYDKKKCSADMFFGILIDTGRSYSSSGRLD